MRVYLDEWDYGIYRPEDIYAAKQALRFEFDQWDMAYSDRRCIESEALAEPYVPTTDPVHPTVWTAQQLNSYAAKCGVDLTELYMDMDRPGFMDD